MKPYIAVLFDSFLESIRSKVLWILLLAWTAILVFLFPLSLTSGENYRITGQNFTSESSPKSIMDALAEASVGKGNRMQRAIYPRLGEEFQSMLKQRRESKRKISVGTLVDELNTLLSIKDLYDAEAWPTAIRRKEIKELLDKKESLNEIELEKLNRKLVDLAFPGSLNTSDGQATWATYGGIKLGSPLPVGPEMVRPFIERGFFPLVMRVGLGIIAMLIAIVITSSLIPDMFQTGSLHLLLSKPLSRSLLFLTKFVGGCIFVAINIIYLIVGLYLYAGIQLKIWNEGILWCIPLFIFMFMVYYSVSSLVGLIWKNPIICVVVTAVFWGACFAVGTIHFFFDQALNVQQQTSRIYSAHNTLISTNQHGRILFWNDEERNWMTAYGDVRGLQVLGPVWVEEQKAVYYARTENIPFGLGGRSNARLDFARTPDIADPTDKTFTSKPWADGRMDSGPEMPSGPFQILPWKNTIAVFNEDGLFELDPTFASSDEKQFAGVTSMLNSFGLGKAISATAFKPIIKGKEFPRPTDLAVAPSFDAIVAVSKGNVTIWQSVKGEMTETKSLVLEGEKDKAIVVGCNNRFAVVCPNGVTPKLIQLEDGVIVRDIDELGPKAVKQVRVSNDGRIAILDRDGDVWVGDSSGERFIKHGLAGQGEGLAIHFNEANELWVAHDVNQADRWNLDDKKVVQSIRPRLTTIEMVYKYFVNPFYLANPKPAAVNQTIDYMLEKPGNKAIAFDRRDLEIPKEKVDPWQPVWSNSAFIVIMLGISCWLLYRQDL